MVQLTSLKCTARQIGIPAWWLKSQAEAGRVPCLVVGTRRYFNAIAVSEALAAQAGNPTTRIHCEDAESEVSSNE